jgi:hypothetical protein
MSDEQTTILSYNECIDMVNIDGWKIQSIDLDAYTTQQKFDICIAAVKSDWRSIKWVKKLTYEICLATVTHAPESLEYISNTGFPDYDMCLIAVKNYSQHALKYVKLSNFNTSQAYTICLAAVTFNGEALQYVPFERFSESECNTICLTAVKDEGSALRYVTKQTPEMCSIAIRDDIYNIDYVKEQTLELCKEMISINNYESYCAIKYIRDWNYRDECAGIVTKHVLKKIREAAGSW